MQIALKGVHCITSQWQHWKNECSLEVQCEGLHNPGKFQESANGPDEDYHTVGKLMETNACLTEAKTT